MHFKLFRKGRVPQTLINILIVQIKNTRPFRSEKKNVPILFVHARIYVTRILMLSAEVSKKLNGMFERLSVQYIIIYNVQCTMSECTMYNI